MTFMFLEILCNIGIEDREKRARKMRASVKYTHTHYTELSFYTETN